MLLWGGSSEEHAKQIIELCRQDLLFWLNTFGWTFDPRKDPSVLPFISWAYQDDGFSEIDRAITHGYDLLIEKSRDMGLSWMVLAVFAWRWMFKDYQAFLVGSRKAEYVDKTGDPKTLFWKLRFLIEKQPDWLRPKYNDKLFHLVNTDNGSVIDGESTNQDFARGDRRTSIFLDEFPAVENGYEILSATADASPCRIFGGTPKGTANAHYEIRQKGDVKVLTYHWSVHPEKAAGLYKDGDTDKLRSPWYDSECKRRTHPMEIAQELDIDYMGSDYQYFDPVVLDRMMRDYCRPPLMVGEFEYGEGQTTRFVNGSRGRWEFWTSVTPSVPHDRLYVISADIATGTGSSPSILNILDRRQNEIIGEFHSSEIRPWELGDLAVAVARYFTGNDGQGAHLIWEANGPGRNFGDRVLDLGYRNIFYRRNESSIGKKVSDFPGWWSTKETKTSLLGEYRRAMAAGELIIRSRAQIEECRHYVWLPNQMPAHSGSTRMIDPSGARDNHGDRVIAGSLAWKCRGLNPAVPDERNRVIKYGTFAWRREHHRQQQLKRLAW